MYRVCRRFTVESGHMLSRHPERCRFPHGHTRTIEVVVAGQELDANGMLIDFKALKMAVGSLVEQFDHAMAVNSDDPFLKSLQVMYPPDALVVFENQEPTTEAIARVLFDGISCVLKEGWREGHYSIRAGSVALERVRVWETPTTWAEYGG
jgi:6-pyruvoyltetrahydropterin/6-carboxytetrahydropterin synthase